MVHHKNIAIIIYLIHFQHQNHNQRFRPSTIQLSTKIRSQSLGIASNPFPAFHFNLFEAEKASKRIFISIGAKP